MNVASVKYSFDFFALQYSKTRFVFLSVFFVFASTILSAHNAIAQKVAPLEIAVIDEYTDVPAHCNYINTIHVSENKKSFNLETLVIMEAKSKAYSRGGNVIKITKRRLPRPFVLHYDLIADVYYTDSLDALRTLITEAPDTITSKLISDTAQYALLYLYRITSKTNSNYDCTIHIDNEANAYKLYPDTKRIIKLEKEGEINLWIDVDNQFNRPINISFGKVYFVRYLGREKDWLTNPKLSVKKPNEGYAEAAQLKTLNQ